MNDGWKEMHAIDSRREKLHEEKKKGESNLWEKPTVFLTKQQNPDSQYRWPFIFKKQTKEKKPQKTNKTPQKTKQNETKRP